MPEVLPKKPPDEFALREMLKRMMRVPAFAKLPYEKQKVVFEQIAKEREVEIPPHWEMTPWGRARSIALPPQPAFKKRERIPPTPIEPVLAEARGDEILQPGGWFFGPPRTVPTEEAVQELERKQWEEFKEELRKRPVPRPWSTWDSVFRDIGEHLRRTLPVLPERMARQEASLGGRLGRLYELAAARTADIAALGIPGELGVPIPEPETPAEHVARYAAWIPGIIGAEKVYKLAAAPFKWGMKKVAPQLAKRADIAAKLLRAIGNAKRAGAGEEVIKALTKKAGMGVGTARKLMVERAIAGGLETGGIFGATRFAVEKVKGTDTFEAGSAALESAVASGALVTAIPGVTWLMRRAWRAPAALWRRLHPSLKRELYELDPKGVEELGLGSLLLPPKKGTLGEFVKAAKRGERTVEQLNQRLMKYVEPARNLTWAEQKLATKLAYEGEKRGIEWVNHHTGRVAPELMDILEKKVGAKSQERIIRALEAGYRLEDVMHRLQERYLFRQRGLGPKLEKVKKALEKVVEEREDLVSELGMKYNPASVRGAFKGKVEQLEKQLAAIRAEGRIGKRVGHLTHYFGPIRVKVDVPGVGPTYAYQSFESIRDLRKWMKEGGRGVNAKREVKERLQAQLHDAVEGLKGMPAGSEQSIAQMAKIQDLGNAIREFEKMAPGDIIITIKQMPFKWPGTDSRVQLPIWQYARMIKEVDEALRKGNEDAFKMLMEGFDDIARVDGAETLMSSFNAIPDAMLAAEGLTRQRAAAIVRDVAAAKWGGRFPWWHLHSEMAPGHLRLDLVDALTRDVRTVTRYLGMDQVKRFWNKVRAGALSPEARAELDDYARDVLGHVSPSRLDKYVQRHPLLREAMEWIPGMKELMKGRSPTRALLGTTRNATSILKLGIFNQSSALANFITGTANTYIEHGPRAMAEGTRLLVRREPRLMRILRRMNLGGVWQQRTEMVGEPRNFLMFSFANTEAAVRMVEGATCFAEVLERNPKATYGELAKAMEAGIDRTQFYYGMAGRGRLLRKPSWQTVLQFKHFYINYINFLGGSATDAVLRGDTAKLGRLLMAQQATSGMFGLPGVEGIDELTYAVFKWSPVDWASQTFPDWFNYGFGSLVGMDWHRKVGVPETPIESRFGPAGRALVGLTSPPALQTGVALMQTARRLMGKPIVGGEGVVAEPPMGADPLKTLTTFSSGIGKMAESWRALLMGDPVVRSGKGRPVDELRASEWLMRAFGITPLRETKSREFLHALMREERTHAKRLSDFAVRRDFDGIAQYIIDHRLLMDYDDVARLFKNAEKKKAMSAAHELLLQKSRYRVLRMERAEAMGITPPPSASPR